MNKALFFSHSAYKISSILLYSCSQAFKTWWGHQYRVGIICPSPPGWDRVKVASAKTWWGLLLVSVCLNLLLLLQTKFVFSKFYIDKYKMHDVKTGLCMSSSRYINTISFMNSILHSFYDCCRHSLQIADRKINKEYMCVLLLNT